MTSTMGIVARITAGAGGALLLAFGLACWSLLVESVALASPSAVEVMVRIELWLIPTAGGGLLYRVALRPSAPESEGWRWALRTSVVALTISMAAILGYVQGARWIATHHATNGLYGVYLLPIGAALFAASVAFYFSGWTAFAMSRRFDVRLLLLAPAGAALLTAVLVFLHP